MTHALVRAHPARVGAGNAQFVQMLSDALDPPALTLQLEDQNPKANLRQVLGLDPHMAARLANTAAWKQLFQEELRLAGLVIDAASRPVDWQQYRDDTADKIRSLVEAKIEGRPLQAPPEESFQVLKLLDALQQSVAAAAGPQPAPASTAGARTKKAASRRRSA